MVTVRQECNQSYFRVSSVYYRFKKFLKGNIRCCDLGMVCGGKHRKAMWFHVRVQLASGFLYDFRDNPEAEEYLSFLMALKFQLNHRTTCEISLLTPIHPLEYYRYYLVVHYPAGLYFFSPKDIQTSLARNCLRQSCKERVNLCLNYKPFGKRGYYPVLLQLVVSCFVRRALTSANLSSCRL